MQLMKRLRNKKYLRKPNSRASRMRRLSRNMNVPNKKQNRPEKRLLYVQSPPDKQNQKRRSQRKSLVPQRRKVSNMENGAREIRDTRFPRLRVND